MNDALGHQAQRNGKLSLRVLTVTNIFGKSPHHLAEGLAVVIAIFFWTDSIASSSEHQFHCCHSHPRHDCHHPDQSVTYSFIGDKARSPLGLILSS